MGVRGAPHPTRVQALFVSTYSPVIATAGLMPLAKLPLAPGGPKLVIAPFLARKKLCIRAGSTPLRLLELAPRREGGGAAQSLRRHAPGPGSKLLPDPESFCNRRRSDRR